MDPRFGHAGGLDLLPDGVDPGHLVNLRGSLDVVVGVGLGDDLEQVALDLTFDPCGGGNGHARFTVMALALMRWYVLLSIVYTIKERKIFLKRFYNILNKQWSSIIIKSSLRVKFNLGKYSDNKKGENNQNNYKPRN